MHDIANIFQSQKQFFQTGNTHAIAFRIHTLKKLHSAILAHKKEITKALYLDLGKSKTESYLTEIGMVLSEISYFLKHLRQFAAPQKVKPSLFQMPAKCFVQSVPYGVTWIVAPWNYPFLLVLQPLVTALAAGNTAICTTSPLAKHTNMVVQRICKQCFPSKYVHVAIGKPSVVETLSQLPFDHIFFTGSPATGKIVMEHAAKHLTPVTLELGGKSPCIVDQTASIPLAAKRIVFGKCVNSGQTCIAPDYIYCHHSVKNQLIQALKTEIQKQYGKNPLQNKQYGRIINKSHFLRLQNLIQQSRVIYGGECDKTQCKIAPTLLDCTSFDSPVMQEEIFGPLLPILTFDDMQEVISNMQTLPAPLALYLFSQEQHTIQHILQNCPSGGVCINDTILHIAGQNMGFGGVGNSGMGAYHGKIGFDTFSHQKSILYQTNNFDISLRYAPYSFFTRKFVSFFLR